jgi:hypothetical protein
VIILNISEESSGSFVVPGLPVGVTSIRPGMKGLIAGCPGDLVPGDVTVIEIVLLPPPDKPAISRLCQCRPSRLGFQSRSDPRNEYGSQYKCSKTFLIHYSFFPPVNEPYI